MILGLDYSVGAVSSRGWDCVSVVTHCYEDLCPPAPLLSPVLEGTGAPVCSAHTHPRRPTRAGPSCVCTYARKGVAATSCYITCPLCVVRGSLFLSVYPG